MYIVIEGCIGSGKTTLAKLLGKKINAEILIEATEKHPFIRDFYLNPAEYAFQTEMNFILIHYHQLQKGQQREIFVYNVISDFLFDKDLLFARLNLKNYSEFQLFKNTYNFLRAKIVNPDLVIYLRAPTDFLYARIKKRKREYERNIPFAYLENLNRTYNEFFDKYPRNRIIIFDAAHLDRKVNKNFLQEVTNSIKLWTERWKIKGRSCGGRCRVSP